MAYDPGFFSSEEQAPLAQLLLNLSKLGATARNVNNSNYTEANAKADALLNEEIPLDISAIANTDAASKPAIR